MRAKDPAAVALGKKRQAAMTADERAQFVASGARAAAEANRKRPPAERRRIARQAAMTKRMRPKWLAPANVVEIERRPTAAELAELVGAIDELSDEELERVASALAGRL